MPRILAYTSPARGHLYPLTPILDELRSRGHELVVHTLESEVGLMRSRGFECEPLDPAVEAGHDDYLARTPLGATKRALRTFGRRAEIDLPDMRAAIDRAAPDALLVDVNAWGAQAAAEASGLPWATWCPFPLPVSSPGTDRVIIPGNAATPARSCPPSTRSAPGPGSRHSATRPRCTKARSWCCT